MGEVSGDHKLWVSLSALGDGNVFAVLPQLMMQMLSDEMVGDTEEDFADVILPSDNAWQTKIYYQLVEKQRLVDAKSEDEKMFDPMIQEEKTKMHEWNTIPKPKLIDCDAANAWIKKTSKAVKGPPPITWTVSDIAKAGCLLSTPAIPTTFEDEHEMRRVYTLIYDVFRYKNVLTQALNDVNFFQIFPKLIPIIPHVWLLFYDLYHRGFKKRETKVSLLASQLFDTYGLSFVENALWCQKVKLAASVARLRIKHNALSLSELLPPHLKDERVTEQAKNNPVTCWINSLKISDAPKLCKDIEEAFSLKMITDLKQISQNNFRWDRHCPQIIAFHSSIRPMLAKSKFVKEHLLIVQDKSFCLGPATFGKLIEDLELTGSVIQTHVNSPRTTAYLATILSHNEKIRKLMAFSAGKRKTEYETYFHELGMSNIVIFSDRLIDTPADAHYMEEVVAVFATPPNSYSAVADPIDLVCSRGGDLSMLEVLTESGDTKEARERVTNILEEQRKTLRFAMSRPQIQFVLYETHSELEAENSFMVKRALREINRIAKLQHAALQGKVLNTEPQEVPEQSEINNNEKTDEIDDDEYEVLKITTEESKSSEDIFDIREKLLDNVNVPDTDIFDVPELPKLCPSENCNNFEKEGCYLALLQRKQIIRLDDKYMIQMAENRGLFGSNTTSISKSKSSRTSKKKQEKREIKQRPRKKLKEAESETYSPNSLWTKWSMLKSMVTIHAKRDITKFKELEAFLKRKSESYKPKKPAVLSPKNVIRFLKNAPNEIHLLHKIARIAAPTHTFLLHTKPSEEVDVCKKYENENAKSTIYRSWWRQTTRHILSLKKTLLKQKVLPILQSRNSNVKAVVNSFWKTIPRVDESANLHNLNTRIPIFPKLRLRRETWVEKAEIPLAVTSVEFPATCIFLESKSW